MDADLLRICEMFIRNRKTLADTFRWDGYEMHLIGSAVLTSHGIEPGAEDLKRCAGIIKDRAKVLSPLRGYLKIIMTASMLMEDDPETYFDNTERAYNLIRITRRSRDDRYYLGAMALANVIEDKEELLGLVDKATELFGAIRSVSEQCEDGRAFMVASILAAAGVEDAEAFLEEANACTSQLEGTFGRTIYTEALGCILALDKADAKFKAARVKEIYKLLDTEGIRYGHGEELPVLGSVAMLDLTNAEAAAALAEADEYLRSQQGFGRFGCGHDKRHMYAALMVISAYASVLHGEQMATGAVISRAISSQFTAMAAGTMILAAEAYNDLTANMGVNIR